jgi:hypothetical protein
MADPRVTIYLCFLGDLFDPEEITSRLGIEPTKSFAPGDPITKSGEGKRLGYGWMLKVSERETLEIDEMLGQLQDRFDVPAAKVKELCKDLGIEPRVIVGVGQLGPTVTTPTLFFPSAFLHWVAGIGAAIDVDIIL